MGTRVFSPLEFMWDTASGQEAESDTPGTPTAGRGPAARQASSRGVAGTMADERWVELYRAYGPLIYAQCRKILADDAAAEDATQETFIRAYKHLEKVRSVKEALPWIYCIATHYCLNVLRDGKQHAQPVAELPELAGANAEEAFSDRDFLLRLLEQVDEQVRVVAWLHYMEGVEQGEVARMLGVSRRTVVYRLAELSNIAERLRARESYA